MDSAAANALSRLDAGSLAAIFDNDPNRIEHPVVQCVQIKPIAAQPGMPERYRVVFSDSRNYVQTMLATTANHHVNGGALRKGCFCKLIAYQANSVKGKRYVSGMKRLGYILIGAGS